MAQAAAPCNHSGCYCKGYVIPTSKWSKGRCKKCNHSEKEHAEIIADVSFESEAIAAVPQQSSQYSANIDRGKTNWDDTGSSKSSVNPEIYKIVLDESDWINWNSNDLLIWFQQKKKFPSALKLSSIEHEMSNNNVNGSKMTQLTHSTLLSYGFTEYDHRTRLLAEIKKLLDAHPPSTQTLKYTATEMKGQNIGTKNEEQKKDVVVAKEIKDEIALLKEANLNESEWKTWTSDQVWQWIKIKRGWTNIEEMDGVDKQRLNNYEEKLKSKDIDLNGAKFTEVQTDIQSQKLLKGIGFPFSMRKKVYKEIDMLIKNNPK